MGVQTQLYAFRVKNLKYFENNQKNYTTRLDLSIAISYLRRKRIHLTPGNLLSLYENS